MQYKKQKISLDIAACFMYNIIAVKNKYFTKAKYFTGRVRMAKNLEISYLLDFYGECLTEKQRSFIDFYYNDDLSLSEIAENENITRQGVRDAIKRAENTLIDLENKLGFAKKNSELTKCLNDISECADQIYDFNLTTNVSKDINDNVAKIKALCEYLNRM